MMLVLPIKACFAEVVSVLENTGSDGSQLLDMSITEKLNIPIGPKSRLIKYLVNLKAAAAARLHALPLLPGSRSLGAS